MAEVAYVPGGMGGDGPDDPNRDKGIQKPDGHDEQPIKAEAKVETEEERQRREQHNAASKASAQTGAAKTMALRQQFNNSLPVQNRLTLPSGQFGVASGQGAERELYRHGVAALTDARSAFELEQSRHNTTISDLTIQTNLNAQLRDQQEQDWITINDLRAQLSNVINWAGGCGGGGHGAGGFSGNRSIN